MLYFNLNSFIIIYTLIFIYLLELGWKYTTFHYYNETLYIVYIQI